VTPNYFRDALRWHFHPYNKAEGSPNFERAFACARYNHVLTIARRSNLH